MNLVPIIADLFPRGNRSGMIADFVKGYLRNVPAEFVKLLLQTKVFAV